VGKEGNTNAQKAETCLKDLSEKKMLRWPLHLTNKSTLQITWLKETFGQRKSNKRYPIVFDPNKWQTYTHVLKVLFLL